MFTVDRVLLVGALLAIIGIASSKLSSRIGLPGLVLFIAVGMLAGSEGIGGIGFEDYRLAHGIGTLALAIIIFDGGLRTSYRTIKPVLAPAAEVGRGVELGPFELRIREIADGKVQSVGLLIRAIEAPPVEPGKG